MSNLNSDLYLRYLINEGMEEKIYEEIPEEDIINIYQPRVRMELDIFSKVGISDYFLILYDLVRYCKEHNIPTGCGRGSAAGSLVAYLLDVTQVDPIPYGLLFERFYNAGRMATRELPDIDLDISKVHRDDVIANYIIPTYGEAYVAPTGSYGILQAKSAVKHLGRVLQVPLEITQKISDSIPTKRGKVGSLNDALDELDNNGDYTRTSSWLREMKNVYPELFKWAPIVDEMDAYQTESVHASAIIISPMPIGEYIPLRWNASKKMACTSYDMYELEQTGLLKLDLLGLRSLDVINETIQRAGLGLPFHDFFKSIPMDDQKTWESLANGQGVGVFQFESPFMRKLLKDSKPACIEDLSSINALGRPGPQDAEMIIPEEDINFIDGEIPPYLRRTMRKKEDHNILNMTEVFIARKLGELKITYLHPSLKPILENSYGTIVYQEQVMGIAQKLGGYNLSEADHLRKIMGKKLTEKIDAEESKFLEGCTKNDIDDKIAKEIWGQIKTFAEYGFNKCLAKGSLIHTKRGVIPIEKVVVGDEVLGIDSEINDDTKIIWRQVKDVHNNGIKTVYRVNTKTGLSQIATKDHRILTSQGFKRVEDIVKGDIIYSPRMIPEYDSKIVDNNIAKLAAFCLSSENIHSKGKEIKIAIRNHSMKDQAAKILQELKAIDIDVAEHNRTSRISGLLRSDIPELESLEHFDKSSRYVNIDEWNIHAVHAFLCTFIDLNWNFNQNKIDFQVAGKPMAGAFYRAFARFGICAKISEFYAEGTMQHRISITGKRGYYLFEKLFCPYLSEQSNSNFKELMEQLAYAKAPYGNHKYICQHKVKSVVVYDDVETYDLELEGPDEVDHVYFADGIATHNSHSISYSQISYASAYLKVNQAPEFMASLISSEQDINKRSLWIHEAKDGMGLRVSPPDINLSTEDFETNDNTILFGLKEIKGVGTATVRAIIKARGNKPFTSMEDFYNRVDLSKVNLGHFKALATTGAFNSLHENRAELIAWDARYRELRFKNDSKIKLRIKNIEEYEGLSKLTDDDIWKQKANKIQKRQLEEGSKTYQELLESLKERLEKKYNKDVETFNKLKDDTPSFEDMGAVPDMNLASIVRAEGDYLGIQISGTLASPYINEIRMYSQMTVADIKDPEFDSKYIDTLCGVLTDIKITSVKNGINKGKYMAIAEFVDLTGSMKLLIFSNKYDEYRDLLIEDKPLVLRARLTDDKDALICMNLKEC